jgi:hypothetical protein
MGKFGDAAIRATELCVRTSPPSPQKAWNRAVAETFPESPSQREKSCPRGTFLGLCEAGCIKNVPTGRYTRSKRNKDYAVAGVRKLFEQGAPLTPLGLWESVTNYLEHNSQMDVVLALWHAGLLVPPRRTST